MIIYMWKSYSWKLFDCIYRYYTQHVWFSRIDIISLLLTWRVFPNCYSNSTIAYTSNNTLMPVDVEIICIFLLRKLCLLVSSMLTSLCWHYEVYFVWKEIAKWTIHSCTRKYRKICALQIHKLNGWMNISTVSINFSCLLHDGNTKEKRTTAPQRKPNQTFVSFTCHTCCLTL